MKNSLLLFLLVFLTAARVSGQCTLSVSLSSSSPNICSGSSAVLTAAASGGTAPYSYVWSTGETTNSINVNKPGTYTVTVIDNTPGCPGVKQSITIGSGVTPVAPTVANATACANSPVTLTATAPGGTYQWYDAATGGNFLASGASYTTPPITASTIFYVETTINGCTGPRAAVTVSVTGKPSTANATVCYGSQATLQASGGGTYAWYASAAGGTVLATTSNFTPPPLLATTTYYVVVTTPAGCVSAPVPVTATVTPPPAAPTASNATVCTGGSVTLHATGTGTIDWFNVPTGGTSLITSPDFTTPSLSATTTYYVQSSVNTCVSTRTPVTVTVSTIPPVPVVVAPPVCSGSTASLTPTNPGPGTYRWYNAQSGGIKLFTGSTFVTPALTSTTTYYVEYDDGCTSPRVPVTVTVTSTPAAPTVQGGSGGFVCVNFYQVLHATGPGGTYEWFGTPSGGTSLFTGPDFQTPLLTANTTYYLQTTIGSCTSARTPVTVTVLPAAAAPAATGASVCPGGVATLTVTSPSSSSSYAWYATQTGGASIQAGPVYDTPPLNTTTTYYVEETNVNGCPSQRTPVTATVIPLPPPPTVAPVAPICPGTAAVLNATGVTGTVTWYDAAVGGNVIGTGVPFTTPVLNSTTTIYVGQVTATCSGPLAPVTIPVSSIANPQFQYPSGTYCIGSANAIPVINNTAGGTFSASPAGLNFVSTSTGEINIGASLPGTYTISFAGNGPCPITYTAKLIITLTQNAQFSFVSPVCHDASPVYPAFPPGASAGVFTATPAGLKIINPSTGEIIPQISTPGTYTITNTIPASGSCAQASFTSTITIDPSVTVNAGPNQTVPQGTPVTMAGSVTGAATTGTWSGGTGSFSNPNALNAIYTPGQGETSATLTLTSSDPPGSCGPKTAKMTVTFILQPAAPTVQGTSVCPGSVATLTAFAPGGTYNWYDAPTGGNLLLTGPTLVTPPLTTNTTYYVSITTSGGTSPRTAVLVTVNTPPPVPTVAPVPPLCAGSSVKLTATGSPSNYEWYGSQTGTDLLWVGATFPTPALTTNTTYWVRSSDAAGCVSGRIPVALTVNPVPNVTSSAAGSVCSGAPLTYTITADQPGATFSWSRAAVAGISNPAVTNQTSSTIAETLNNTGTSALNVTYIITPSLNGCVGTPFDYVVTVNPAVTLVNTSAPPVCNGWPINFTIQFNIPGTPFSWSRAAVAGISNPAVSGQGSSVIKESLQNTTTAPITVTYIISFSSPGCPSQAFPLTVTVNPSANITSTQTPQTACSGVAFDYTITSDQPNATFTWSRAAVTGISNPPVTGQTSSKISETLVNTTTNVVPVVYAITSAANGCPGNPLSLTVNVNPVVPTPVINANSPVCTGTDITLQSPTVPNATYNWSGPNGFTSTQQNPVISNVTAANSGTYSLFITINGCNSTVVTANVVVDPLPLANAGTDQQVCTNTTSVPISGTVTGGTTTGIWTTAGTGSFGSKPNVLNNTYLPSAQDIASGSVVLILSSTSKDNCNVSTSSITITFKAPSVTSALASSVCNGMALNYTMTSDFPTATFTWSRAAVAGISNPAVSNQTSGTITETLINTGTTPITVNYIIIPSTSGCPGNPATYAVTVNPIPPQPTATSNSPVCVNTSINLQTAAVAGATYNWTGPNGFTSTQQNPVIANVTSVNAGNYSLTLTVNGCTSPAAVINVVVDPLPIANAGPDQTICPTATGLQLAGTVTGGTTTGIWTTSGTGTFTGGGSSTTILNGQYFPSPQDVSNGAVELTLTSTSKDNCTASVSKMTVLIQLLKAVTAGPGQTICSKDNAQLAGQITIPGGGTWTTSGTGTFSPSASQLNALYVPSVQDIKNGSVVLTLTANSPGSCYIPTDRLIIAFAPPPTVSAGPTKYVLKGETVTLDPTVSDPNVTYSWSPNIGISSTTAKNPVVTGNVDETYTLTVTDSRGCTATSSVKVIVSPTIVIPNAFTPNGDGVNDQWNIIGLTAYQHSTIDIYDRNGQKVFHSIGYGVPWDGTYAGKQVPYGVYYYIINPNFRGLSILSGSVTVIR